MRVKKFSWVISSKELPLRYIDSEDFFLINTTVVQDPGLIESV